jgi:hypothetical protein
MTARLSEAHHGRSLPSPLVPDRDRSTAEAELDRSPDVVSVSARAAVDDAELPLSMSATTEVKARVFLTPRVIDQEAFDDLAASLRALIDRADESARQLDQRVEQSAAAGRDHGRAATRLQERLRLSASMLKAFQSQIARTEAIISAMVSHEDSLRLAEDRVGHVMADAENTVAKAVDDAIAQLDERLNASIDAAIERLEREVEARSERVRRAMKQVEAAALAAERLTELAERAEVGAVRASCRVASLILALAECADAAKRLVAESDAKTELMQTALNRAESRAMETADAAQRSSQRVAETCERAEKVRGELVSEIEAAHGASRGLAIDIEACESLERMLDQLKPWESLVLSIPSHDATAPEADQGNHHIELPAPAARLIDEMRSRIDRDLNAFSAVLSRAGEQLRALSDQNQSPPSDEAEGPLPFRSHTKAR